MTKKILIADDNQLNRILLETLLRSDGYDVMCAESGQSLLDALLTYPADLILLDLIMPGMDGFDVMRRLKSNPKTHRIPVIVVTALDDSDSQTRLFSSGAVDIISKPLDRGELKTCVERALNISL